MNLPDIPQTDTVRNGILLSQDLLFTSKITGTARELGYVVSIVVNKTSAMEAIRAHPVAVVFLDLTAGGLTAPEAIRSYREIAGQETVLVAFGPHVDVDTLDAARQAGCDIVMPRSQFSAQLPA